MESTLLFLIGQENYKERKFPWKIKTLLAISFEMMTDRSKTSISSGVFLIKWKMKSTMTLPFNTYMDLEQFLFYNPIPSS